VAQTALALVYIVYGLKRFTLGIDFTDEGAYVSWPLRMLFGERPFTSEILTLTRPIEVFLSPPLNLYPAFTLYGYRILGWSIHIAAFSVLSYYLFKLSNSPLTSPLIASIPLYVCHIFGLAPPSYNTFASDFFTAALSMLGLATGCYRSTRSEWYLQIGAGLALFVATFAHPALGLVALLLVTREVLTNTPFRNILRRRMVPSNAAVLSFVMCWAAFIAYCTWSGALVSWIDRVSSVELMRRAGGSPLGSLLVLALHPFIYSRLAVCFSASATVILCLIYASSFRKRITSTSTMAALLAFLLTASIIISFSREPELLTSTFAFVGLLLAAMHVLGPAIAEFPLVTPSVRFLFALSAIGAVLCATTTYYFHPLRSWTSGILALPFAFSTGLTLLMATKTPAPAVLRTIVGCSLMLAVACVAREHYRSLWRELSPSEMISSFKVPKLRFIRSTAERTSAIDALYAKLHPKLVRGEPLLVFDDAPMLYFILDARPVYGLTWASRYNQTPSALKILDGELRSAPLPRFAVRTLVNISYPVWANAARTNYDNYPLNDTVMEHYELEETVFPFEIWRLRNRGM
jgi:hypothetical protein